MAKKNVRPGEKDEGWIFPPAYELDPDVIWADDLPTEEWLEPGEESPFDAGFLTDVPWGGVLFQQAPGDEEENEKYPDDIGGTRERVRTSQQGECRIDAAFAFSIHNRAASDREVALFRWQRLRPEFGMPWAGRLAARVKIVRVEEVPGTATIEVRRSGSGPPIQNATRTAHGDSIAAIRAQFAAQPPIRIDPPDIGPNDPPVTEEITAHASWDPDEGEPCEIDPPESVSVRWYRGARFNVILPKLHGRKRGTHARVGTALRPEQSDGDTFYVVPTEMYWEIGDDPLNCCGEPVGFAVIQFVHNTWRLNERPRREGRDNWSLDILDSQIDKAGADPAEDYDPTFTHNPGGSDPDAPPITYPSPNGLGDLSLVQIDAPGLSEALYNRLLGSGGKFVWKFISFLVCKVDPPTAAEYRAEGKVVQEMRWHIEAIFEGDGAPPTVKGKKKSGFPKRHRCRPFEEFLNDEEDVESGYEEPTGHTVEIPVQGS